MAQASVPVSPAARAALLAALPVTRSATTFVVTPASQSLAPQRGTTPVLWMFAPSVIAENEAYFLSTTTSSSLLGLQNLGPGSWLLDCEVLVADDTPFTVYLLAIKECKGLSPAWPD